MKTCETTCGYLHTLHDLQLLPYPTHVAWMYRYIKTSIASTIIITHTLNHCEKQTTPFQLCCWCLVPAPCLSARAELSWEAGQRLWASSTSTTTIGASLPHSRSLLLSPPFINQLWTLTFWMPRTWRATHMLSGGAWPHADTTPTNDAIILPFTQSLIEVCKQIHGWCKIIIIMYTVCIIWCFIIIIFEREREKILSCHWGRSRWWEDPF